MSEELNAEEWVEQHLWLRDVRLGRGDEVRLYAGTRLVCGTLAEQVTASIDAMLAAAEQRGVERGLSVAEGLLRGVKDYWDGRPLAHHGEHIHADLLDVLRGITPVTTEPTP